VRERGDAGIQEVLIDSTVVRAHQHAAGAPGKRGREAHAPGRSQGGFSTKLHATCADQRTGVRFALTGGERNDVAGFDLPWERLDDGPVPEAAVMNKALRQRRRPRALAVPGIEAVIPCRMAVPGRSSTKPSTPCG